MRMWLFLSFLSINLVAAGGHRFEFDVISLVAGKEERGVETYQAERYGTTYLFKNADNRDLFLKDPDAYALQNAGYCSRMGGFSEKGKPDLYTVFENKVYVFGSETCRGLFLENPSKTFDPDQIPPRPMHTAVKEGKRLIALWSESVGAKSRLDAIQVYAESSDQELLADGEVRAWRQKRVLHLPQGYRYELTLNDHVKTRLLEGDRGWLDSDGHKTELAPVQIRELTREIITQPLTLLFHRKDGQMIAIAGNDETFDGEDATTVLVSMMGLNQTLVFDKNSGDLLAQRYRGRGSNSLYTNIEKRFSDFTDVEGLRFPQTVTWLEGGKLWKTVEWNIEVQ